jgi:Polyketide cyclase / dehydrase and lipid transport
VAVRTSRQLVIEAPPEAIMDALADVEALLSSSRAYRRAEVLDRYDDGRPHHVRLAVRVLGLLDEEVLEFRWGPNWLVWDAERTKQQYAQHVEYKLQPDHTGSTTMVTVDITVEPDSLIPDFLIKKAGKSIIDAATEGLRDRVLRGKASDQPERSE